MIRLARLLEVPAQPESTLAVGHLIARHLGLENPRAQQVFGLGFLLTATMQARDYVIATSNAGAMAFNLQPIERVVTALAQVSPTTPGKDYTQRLAGLSEQVRGVGFNLPTPELPFLDDVPGVPELIEAITRFRENIVTMTLSVELQRYLQMLLNKLEFDLQNYLVMGGQAIREDYERLIGMVSAAVQHGQVAADERETFIENAWEVATRLDTLITLYLVAHQALPFVRDVGLPVLKALLSGGQPD